MGFSSEYCTYGGYIQGYNASDLTVIRGKHQVLHSLSKNEDAYFTIGRGICKMANSSFFDVQYDSGVDYASNTFGGVKYSVRAPLFEGVNLAQSTVSDQSGVRFRKRDMSARLGGNAVKTSNRLPRAFYGVDYQKFANNIGTNGGVFTQLAVGNTITNVTYDITDRDNNVVTLNEGNTFGYYDLFYPDKLNIDYMTGDVLEKNTQHFSYYKVLEDVEEYGEIVKKPIPVKAAHVGFNVVYSSNETLVIDCFNARVSSLIVKVTDVSSGNVLEQKEYGTSFYYYNPVYHNLPYRSGKIHIDVDITYNQAMRCLNLPFVGLCGDSVGELIGSWGGYTIGPLLSRELIIHNPDTDLVSYLGHPNLNFDWNRHSYDDGGYIQVPYLAFRQSSGYPVAVTISGSSTIIKLNIYYDGSTVSCSAIVNGTYRKDMVNVRWTGTSSNCLCVITCGYQHRAFISDLSTMNGVRILKLEKSGSNYLIDGETLDMTSFNTAEILLRPNITVGASNARPTSVGTTDTWAGYPYYDVTYHRPCWWDSSKWRESDGAVIGSKRSGGDGESPTSANIYNGFRFFNTTTKAEEFHAGSDIWVDAFGNKTSARKAGIITLRPALADIVTGFTYIVTQEFNATIGGASTQCPAGAYIYAESTGWAAPNGGIIADTDLPTRA